MNPHRVQFVYLYPTDGQNRAEAAIRSAALDLQAWIRWQMGNSKTFTLADLPVIVRQTNHSSAWYSTFTEDPTVPHREWYWANAQRDARDFAGVTFYQWNRTFVVYVDAPTVGDQHAGGASAGNPSTGICVLPKADVDALLGQHPTWTVCRELGGCCHEYLHTHNVPHPPPGPDFGRSVMGTGYTIYPRCVLLDSEKAMLDVHPFFDVRPKLPIGALCPFDDRRPQRPPRPPPTPHPRPDCPLVATRKVNQ